jgi:hypothetical protein
VGGAAGGVQSGGGGQSRHPSSRAALMQV